MRTAPRRCAEVVTCAFSTLPAAVSTRARGIPTFCAGGSNKKRKRPGSSRPPRVAGGRLRSCPPSAICDRLLRLYFATATTRHPWLDASVCEPQNHYCVTRQAGGVITDCDHLTKLKSGDSSMRPRPDVAKISHCRHSRYAIMLMAWRAAFLGHLMVLIYGLVFGYSPLHAPLRRYDTPELWRSGRS